LKNRLVIRNIAADDKSFGFAERDMVQHISPGFARGHIRFSRM
jgi:hypothetical protein